ncbi:MAG: cobalamin biosynthesis protein CbiX [Cypionkella sp.]|nr:cobalamin biosynthesis protein CbiX [Cypionkella sp.]
MMDDVIPLVGTAPAALIVAHGQPSDPGPAAAEIAALAARVAACLPGWRVASATLAEEGALAAQVAALGPEGLVYPLFMAGGWFTRVNLPARLAEAGGAGWRVLAPFGTDAGVQDLAETLAREAGLGPGGELLLAAHGSFRSPAPAEVAEAVAARIGRALGLARAEAAFIDQSPRLAEVRGFGPGAVCLPFFAARGGHVIDDLPEALGAAGFAGRILPPLGLDPRVPGLIAGALQRAAAGG